MNGVKDYGSEFSDDGFRKFTSKFKGLSFIRNAVTMYFCFVDPETDVITKGIIIAALGYMICPVDAVPDIMPIVGFSDDAGVIALAFCLIQSQVTDKHRQQTDKFLGIKGKE